jgi:hypothetical protein
MHTPSFRRPLGRRAKLESRYRDLVAEVTVVDADEQRLARRMTELRRELRTLHDRLWPTGDGHAFKSSRRPRIGGPAPIPPPVGAAISLWGRSLRYAALGVLLRAERPLTLEEIHRALHLTGYRLRGRHPVKQLADALGYEHRNGRARRVARGTYRIGELTPARRRKAFDASRPRAPAAAAS